MDLSLVICTSNRAHLLRPFLLSLERIEYPGPWEIIFVDNASTDDTQTILEEFTGRHCHTKIVHEKKAGLGNARNAGWKAASAPIIAFTDDDCYPDKDFLNAIMRSFENPEVGYVGGRVLLHDPLDLPVTIKLDETSMEFKEGQFIGPGYLHGANFAMRRIVLEQINGFDGRFGSGTPYPCEDCDAFLRASFAMWVGKYSPDVVVSHHHRRRGQEDLEKIQKAYLAGRAAFYAKSLMSGKHTLSILVGWGHSIRCFGWLAWFQELPIAIQYLVGKNG